MGPVDMKPEWEFLTKSIYDPEVFWVMVTAVATVFLVILAAVPLWSLAKTRRTDLVRRLRDDFWTTRARAILYLVDHGMLQYVADNPPYFSIAGISYDPAEHRMRDAFGDRAVISAFEIDDELLNPLEEVAALAYGKAISLEDVYALFGNFMKSTAQNAEIQKHIADVRKSPKSANAWMHLERIVPKLDRLDEEFLKRSQIT
jgi:hypothetical protein